MNFQDPVDTRKSCDLDLRHLFPLFLAFLFKCWEEGEGTVEGLSLHRKGLSLDSGSIYSIQLVASEYMVWQDSQRNAGFTPAPCVTEDVSQNGANSTWPSCVLSGAVTHQAGPQMLLLSEPWCSSHRATRSTGVLPYLLSGLRGTGMTCDVSHLLRKHMTLQSIHAVNV